MSKLRIGIILNDSFTPAAGGGFSYYNTLVQAIDSYHFNNELEFVFVSFGDKISHQFAKEVVTVDVLQNYSGREKLIREIAGMLKKIPVIKYRGLAQRFGRKYSHIEERHLIKKLIDHRIDLMYSLLPFSQFLNYPFVETHWDIGHCSMFPFPEVAMNGIFQERERYYSESIMKAFAIFCESEAGIEEMLYFKKINPERIFKVPLFPGKVTSLALEEPVVQQHLNAHSLKSYQFFFYPAQFWAHKNHYTLLRAFKKLSTEYPHVKLVLSGSDKGNKQYILSIIKEQGLENNVVIPGFVPEETIYAFYKTAVALVMPTFLGPTNMPLLEAQEIGCPVICSDFKGHRELLIGDKHIFVSPDDDNMIYLAMRTMLTNPPNRRGTVSGTFNLDNCLQSIEQAFLKIKKRRKAFGLDFTA